MKIAERDEFQKSAIVALGRPELRKSAADILGQRGNASGGFLADLNDFETVRRSGQWYDDGRLQLRMTSTDPAADTARMDAFLRAIDAASGPDRDLVARQRDLREQAARIVALAQAKVDQLNRQKELARGPALLRPAEGEIASLETKLAEAKRIADAAAAVVVELERQYNAATKPATRSMAPVPMPAAPPPDAAAAPAAEARRIQRELDALAAQIASLRQRQNLDEAAAAAEHTAAQERFDAALTAVRTQGGVGPDDLALADAMQKVQDSARALSLDLRQRRKDHRLAVDDARRRVDRKIESERQKLCEQDADLTALSAHRDLVHRKWNAALAAGQTDDAESQKIRLDDLDRRIAARRDALLAGMPLAELRAGLDETLRRHDADFASAQARIEESLLLLQKQMIDGAATAAGMSGSRRDAAVRLTDLAQQLWESRRVEQRVAQGTYAQEITAQIAQAQSAADSLRRQAADASAQLAGSRLGPTPPVLEVAAPATTNADASAALLRRLDAARLSRDQAMATLSAARRAVEDAKMRESTAQNALTALATVEQELRKANDDVEAAKARLATAQAAVAPVFPDPYREGDVTSRDPDWMLWALVGTTAGIALLFALLMLLWGRGKEEEPELA